MSDLPEEVLKLELSDDVFKGIKFFISGDVHEKVLKSTTKMFLFSFTSFF